MLPARLTYPLLWPVTYKGKDGREYASTVMQVHFDDIEPYYTINVLEGPYACERQTVKERLKSWVDDLDASQIKKEFERFIASTQP